jgi:hypothetical protein
MDTADVRNVEGALSAAMLITPHAMTGAALAASFESPFVGVFLAFASHYLLDAIPSWDVGMGTTRDLSILFADAMLTIAALTYALRRTSNAVKILIWAGAVVALLPDILSQSLLLAGFRHDLLVLHLHQYLQTPAPLAVSLTFQVFLSIIMLMYLTKRIKMIVTPPSSHITTIVSGKDSVHE